MIQIRLCEQVSDKKLFTWPISGNKTNFFGLSDLKFKIKFMVLNIHEYSFTSFLF